MHGIIKAISPDVNLDGKVDLTDLILTWQHEFTSNLTYDVNLDGAVDLNDLIIVWSHQFIQ